MPTYVYETVSEPHVRFEIKQSMKEDALTVHPETGEPVRRLISGGYGLMEKATTPKRQPKAPGAGGCCGGGCGCGHH